MPSPEGRKKAFLEITHWFALSVRCEDRDKLPGKFLMRYKRSYRMLILTCFPPVAELAVRDIASNRSACRSDRPLATSKCDAEKTKPTIHASCRNDRWVKRSVLTHRLIAAVKDTRRNRSAHHVHKTAPYKISSVRSAFARKLLTVHARPATLRLVSHFVSVCYKPVPPFPLLAPSVLLYNANARQALPG
jgi:hypothetical protein